MFYHKAVGKEMSGRQKEEGRQAVAKGEEKVATEGKKCLGTI